MALWDKLKTELDRAGRAAQTAFDEGKVRLEVLRVRQLADKAAQALGYAVFNARKNGGELDDETYARLSSTLAAHEAEIARMEAQMAAEREQSGAADTPPTATATPTDDAAPPPAGSSAHTGGPPVDPAMGDTGPSDTPRPPGF